MAADFRINNLIAQGGSFTERPTVNGTGVLLEGDSTTGSFLTTGTADLRYVEIADLPVYQTGNQIISGTKTFHSGLLVQNGNVGIGTLTPTSKLEVVGDSKISGNLNITNYNTGVNALDRFTIDGAAGRLFGVSDSVTGTIFSVNDAAGLPIIEVESNLTDKITMGTYGSNALVVNNTSVGIGTATPSGKLEVIGDTKISGNLIFTDGGTRTISGASATVAGAGTSLNIRGGNANTAGVGGSINLIPGIGAGGPGNGDINIGSSTLGIAQAISLYAPTTTINYTGPNLGTPLIIYGGGRELMSFNWDNINNVTSLKSSSQSSIRLSGALDYQIMGSTPTSSRAALNVVNSNNSSIAYFRNDGNVGVATTIPNYKFSVKPTAYSGQIGVGAFPGGGAAPTLYLEDYNSTSAFKLGLDNSNVLKLLSPSDSICLASTANGTAIYGNGTIVEAGNSSSTIQAFQSKILLDTYSTNAIQFFAGSTTTERMRILGSNGNVGIGTTSPEAALQVGSTGGHNWRVGSSIQYHWAAEANPRISISNGGIGSTSNGLRMKEHGAGTLADNGVSVAVVTAKTLGFSTSDGTNLVERMRVDGSGYVGIGTTTPTEKLDVAGNVKVSGALSTNSLGVSGASIFNSSAAFTVRPTVNGTGVLLLGELATGSFLTTGDANLQYVEFADLPVFQTGNQTISGTKTFHSGLLVASGNVGIGTITPAGVLDVTSAGDTSQPQLAVGKINHAGWIRFRRGSDGANAAQIGYGNPTDFGPGFNINSGGGQGTITMTAAGGPVTIYAGNVNPTIFASNGSVGINTLTPSGKLDIRDTTLAGSASLSGSALNVEQTWNTSGTPAAIKLNVTDTLSNASSSLMDLQVSGISRFKITKAGAIDFGPSNLAYQRSVINNGAGQLAIFARGDVPTQGYAAAGLYNGLTAGLFLGNIGGLQWSNGSFADGGSYDLTLVRDSAHVLAQRNGINPQESRIYGTYTNSTHFERLNLKYNATSSAFQIGTEKGSVSGLDRPLEIMVGGTTGISILPSNQMTLAKNTVINGYVLPSYLKLVGGGGESHVYCAGDGNLTLYNAGETSFNRIQLGGTTSAFPSIKRNGTGIQFRLADDSENAPIEASAGIFSTTLNVSGASVFNSTAAFTVRPTVNSSGVLLQGELATGAFLTTGAADLRYVAQTGDQTISGVKTFATGLLVQGDIQASSITTSSITTNSATALSLQYAAAGDVAVHTNLRVVPSGGSISINNDTFLTRRGAANFRLGAADAAAPVAQTLSVQSVSAGATNTAGANLTVTSSQGTGTGVGGSIIFQVAPAGTSGTSQNALIPRVIFPATSAGGVVIAFNALDSSNVALRSTGTTLDIVRGDASSFANLTAQNITAQGTISTNNFAIISNVNVAATTGEQIAFITSTTSNGTAANGFGTRIALRTESSTTADRDSGAIAAVWSDATDATRTSNLLLYNTLNGTLTERLRILGTNGNVGIGTSAPQMLLDVNGNTRAGGFFAFDRTGGNNTATIQVKARGATEGSNFGNPIGDGSGEIITSGLNGLIIGNQNTTPLVLGTNNLERIRILAAGNVGIGTSTPTEKLEVAGNAKINGVDSVSLTLNKLASTNNSSLSFTTSGSTNASIQHAASGNFIIQGPNSYTTQVVAGTSGTLSLGTGASGTIIFNIGSSEVARILTNGNLGIGTSTPSAKLHVLGANYLTSIIDAPLYPALHWYSNGVSIGYIGSGNISGAAATDLGIQAPSGSKLFLAAGNTTAALTVATGRVGVGTQNPSTALHVYSATTAVATFDGPTNPLAAFSIANSSFATFGSAGGALTGGTATDLAFQTSNNLVFAAGGTALSNIRMFVASAGNVGIGTTTPSEKLEVAGNAKVSGHFSAATKSFLIPHPTKADKQLQYGVVESDQHSVLVRGKTSEAVIELPEEWIGLVHEDSVTVQLTPIGSYQQLFVVSQDNQRVIVGGSTGEYNYTIYGERKDVDKLITEI